MNQVSVGFNMYMDIDTACNSSCPFCIAPTVGRRNDPGFADGLNAAIEFTEKHRGSIQVVGGEPMISSRFPLVMARLAPYDFHRVVVNTNGTFISEDRKQEMVNGKVSHINISRHHYDEQLNQEIMHNRPFLSNKALTRTITSLPVPSIRLNCNIIKGHIDSIDEIDNYIDWAESVGIPTVSFSQVYPLSLFTYQVPPVPGYTESVQVDLNKLVQDIDTKYLPVEIDEFEARIGKVMDNWGSKWYMPSTPDNPTGNRRYWKRNNTIFSLKTLAGYSVETGLPLPTEYNAYDDIELGDKITFAVLHPDGRITASWDRTERLIPAEVNVMSADSV